MVTAVYATYFIMRRCNSLCKHGCLKSYNWQWDILLEWDRETT